MRDGTEQPPGPGRLQDSSTSRSHAGFPPYPSLRLTRRQAQATEASHGRVLRRPAQRHRCGDGARAPNVIGRSEGKGEGRPRGRGLRALRPGRARRARRAGVWDVRDGRMRGRRARSPGGGRIPEASLVKAAPVGVGTVILCCMVACT